MSHFKIIINKKKKQETYSISHHSKLSFFHTTWNPRTFSHHWFQQNLFRWYQCFSLSIKPNNSYPKNPTTLHRQRGLLSSLTPPPQISGEQVFCRSQSRLNLFFHYLPYFRQTIEKQEFFNIVRPIQTLIIEWLKWRGK